MFCTTQVPKFIVFTACSAFLFAKTLVLAVFCAARVPKLMVFTAFSAPKMPVFCTARSRREICKNTDICSVLYSSSPKTHGIDEISAFFFAKTLVFAVFCAAQVPKLMIFTAFSAPKMPPKMRTRGESNPNVTLLPPEVVKKNPYKFAIRFFTLSFFFLPYRFTGFGHSIIFRQTWRGSCTCDSNQEITSSVSMISGWWCLKLVFGLILLSFLLSFCVLCRVHSPNPCPWDTRLLDLFMQC